MIANKYYVGSGKGASFSRLVAFDKALLSAGVGNYNLVRLSSILPAEAKRVEKVDMKEGSFLPTAYATISSSKRGEKIASAVAIGFPKDASKVGVIMEYSNHGNNINLEYAMNMVKKMVVDAFAVRGWELKNIVIDGAEDVVNDERIHTTFACIAEWEGEEYYGKTENRN